MSFPLVLCKIELTLVVFFLITLSSPVNIQLSSCHALPSCTFPFATLSTQMEPL